MPSLLARLLLTVWCLCASPLWAANTVPDNAIVLNDQTPVLEVNTPIQTWIDEGSHANIDLVAGGAATLPPHLHWVTFPLTSTTPCGSSCAWCARPIRKQRGP